MRGGGKSPPGLGGLGGSDWNGEKFGRSEEKKGDLHADPIGRRIICKYIYIYIVRARMERKSASGPSKHGPYPPPYLLKGGGVQTHPPPPFS